MADTNDPAFLAWKAQHPEYSWIDDQTGRTMRAYYAEQMGKAAGSAEPATGEAGPAEAPAPEAPVPEAAPSPAAPAQGGQPLQGGTYNGPGGWASSSPAAGGGSGGASGSGSGTVGPGTQSGGGGSGMPSSSLSGGGSSGGGGSSSSPFHQTGMGVAPGTITSVKSNQAAPSTNYGPLIQSMTQGSAKNLKGYNDQIDNALKGANDMYAKILGLTTGSRDTQTELAKQQEASRESDIQQRMAATGLGNSTVLPSLLTQQQQVGNLTMNDINQKARQDQINAMMPQIQTQIGLKQGKANTNLGYNPTNTQLLSMLLPMIQGGSAGAGGTNLGSIMSLLGR